MRTSPAQFEMMVHFMEQHGDISKPSKDPRGRLRNEEHWENLAGILNSEGSGESRPAGSWKKVWSDIKNNSKKTAAKINIAARGTGGGPACTTRLSDLEQRVLTIIGPQAATGLLVVQQAGLPQGQAARPETDRTATLPSVEPSLSIMQMALDTDVVEGLWTEEALAVEQPVAGRSAESAAVPMPTRRGHTPGRPRRLRRGSTSRRRRRTLMEQTAQHLADSDQQWRNFLMQKHRDEIALKERELVSQQRWQEISREIVGIFNKLVNK